MIFFSLFAITSADALNTLWTPVPIGRNTPTPVPLIKITPTPAPALPAAIEVTLSRDYVDANGPPYDAGGDRITIRALVTDGHGKPVPDGTRVNFVVDEPDWTQSMGTLDAADSYGIQYLNGVLTSSGIATTEFGGVTPQFAGRTIKLTAYCADKPSITGSASVLTKPCTLSIEASRDFVAADKADSIVITAHMYGSDGSPVADGTRLNFMVDMPDWTSHVGSISTSDAWQGLQYINGMQTADGAASIRFGWAEPDSIGTGTKITVKSTDYLTASTTVSLNPVDNTPPVTTILLAGTTDTAGAFTTPVEVTLTAADSGAGVKSTEYSFTGDAWNPYAGPFTVSNPGTTTVYYRSTDKSANTEPSKVKPIVLAATVTGSPATPAPTSQASNIPTPSSTAGPSNETGNQTQQQAGGSTTPSPTAGKSGLPFAELTVAALAAAGLLALAGMSRKK